MDGFDECRDISGHNVRTLRALADIGMRLSEWLGALSCHHFHLVTGRDIDKHRDKGIERKATSQDANNSLKEWRSINRWTEKSGLAVGNGASYGAVSHS